MEKLLSLILVFVLILPLCGRGFAAYDNLALSAFKSELEDGVIVNTFVYVGEGGHVARREIDRIAPSGQLLGKQTTNYDAKGNMISGMMAGFIGVCRASMMLRLYLSGQQKRVPLPSDHGRGRHQIGKPRGSPRYQRQQAV